MKQTCSNWFISSGREFMESGSINLSLPLIFASESGISQCFFSLKIANRKIGCQLAEQLHFFDPRLKQHFLFPPFATQFCSIIISLTFCSIIIASPREYHSWQFVFLSPFNIIVTTAILMILTLNLYILTEWWRAVKPFL